MIRMGIGAIAVIIAATGLCGEKVPLWPSVEKIPNFQEKQYAAMTDETLLNGNWRTPNPAFDKSTHRMPYIEWCEKPAKPNGGVMITISGGAYSSCCDGWLVKKWQKRFTELGYQCVNLVYRTPRPDGIEYYRSAWQDGQRAVRLVRAAAKARGLNPEKIGAIGMSAGGHLTTLLATSSLTPAYEPVDELDKTPCHINWAIANAPAYNTATAGGLKGIARKEDGTTFLDLKPDPALKFDAKTCPISFHHGAADVYTPNGSTQCYRELRRRKIPAELHLYADQGHGAFGLERAVEFMNQMEFTSKLPREQREDHRWMPGWTIRTEKEMLWPKGKIPDISPNQKYEPYLVWYIPEKPTTKAIQVITPGGGYGFCNFIGEGVPVAHYLNQKGMTAVVVMYRCGRPWNKPKHLSGWQDTQRAIRMIRAEAPARGLDPNRIGIMGFSAGGHLTLQIATNGKTPAYQPIDEIDKQPFNVQWACPIYPAYALTDGPDSPNKLGGNDDSAVPVPEFAFDELTPPMCFVHGDADGFSAMNSVKCWEKLRAMGKSSELHTLAKRGHCFQMVSNPGTGSYTWLDRIWDFLSQKKFNK